MALFGNNRESQRMSAMREAPKPVEKLEMLIEYYDQLLITSKRYNTWSLVRLKRGLV